MFQPPTSSLAWGECIKYCNKGDMGAKRNLVFHLNIKFGYTNNKYGENKVAFPHKDIWRFMKTLGD